jgi:hypothetical protein
MPRIEDSLFQQDVENSILDDSNIIATLTHEGNFVRPEDVGSEAEPGESVFDNPSDYFAEELYDQEHNPMVLGDEGLAQKVERETGQRQERRQPWLSEEESATLSLDERLQRRLEREEEEQPRERLRSERVRENDPEQQQAEAQPLTPEAIREGLEGLGAFVEANQLNEGTSAATFPHEICAALGTTVEAAEMNPQETVDLSSKTVAAELREFELCKGDVSKIPEMPDELAFASGYQWAKAHGYNPQDPNIDLRGLGRMARQGTLSILYAINAGYGEPEQINVPANIKWFAAELQKNLGSQRQIPYEMARAYCNAYAKRVLGLVEQLRQNQSQGAASQSRSRKASGQRIPAGLRDGFRGKKPPRFETNRDIFSGPGFEAGLRQQL